MQHYENLVIIGGTGRNVGKTEFICRLIKNISRDNEVFALKVSAVFPDELQFHGDHGDGASSGQLFEERRYDTRKDTSRMLRAGAKKVFFLCCENNKVERGFEAFLQKVPPGAAVICESNSLAEFVRPALNIMLKSKGGSIKKRAVHRVEQADVVIESDGRSGFSELGSIHYEAQSGWAIKRS